MGIEAVGWISQRDHVKGNVAAAVALLEYGDFECRRCAEAFHTVKDALLWLDCSVCFAFRHFPVAEKHPRAFFAAQAAEAAGAQGKFWEMHDSLYEHSPAFDEGELTGYAEQLGISMDQFKYEMLQNVYIGRVREDLTTGVASGVDRTPTFFVNGVRYRGECELDSLLAAIEEAGISG